jgi:peptidoglycan hydrolase-like protein with peptidoglycan-binding domain
MIQPFTLRRATLTVAFVAQLGGAAGCVHTHAAPPSASVVAATKPDHELGAETGIPVSSTPRGLMHEGAEKLIQQSLRDAGFLKAEQGTGQIDADTREALRQFQASEGLPRTGLPSYETVDHLGLDLDTIFRSAAHPANAPPAGSPSPR